MELLHADVTKQILKTYFQVYNDLGYGFLERVYENAMAIALRGMGLDAIQQAPIEVRFAGQVVGEYYADLLVDRLVIVEIKAAKMIVPEHEAQLLNYLKATACEVGLLLNFGPTPHHIRRVMENARKGPRRSA